MSPVCINPWIIILHFRNQDKNYRIHGNINNVNDNSGINNSWVYNRKLVQINSKNKINICRYKEGNYSRNWKITS